MRIYDWKGRKKGWVEAAVFADEVENGQPLGHTMCADFSPDGKTLVYGDTRGRLYVHRGAKWKRESTKVAHPASHVREVRFDATGERLVSIGVDIRVWSSNGLELLETITVPDLPPQAFLMSMSLSPDGKTLVCVDSAGTLHVVPMSSAAK